MNKKRKNDYRDHLNKLIWQKLQRDKDFWDWCKDQTNKDLKNNLEEKYSISINTDPQFHFWYHPSAVTFLDSDDLNPDNQNLYRPFREIILKIDVSKINPVTDITPVLKEIKQEIEAKIEMRKNVITKDTRINEEAEELENLKDLHDSDYTKRPHDFDKDLKFFVQYEQGKVKSPTSRETKILDKMHRLLYGISLSEGRKRPERYTQGKLPCDNCNKRDECNSKPDRKSCEKLERFLRQDTGYGYKGLNIQRDKDEFILEKQAFEKWKEEQRCLKIQTDESIKN